MKSGSKSVMTGCDVEVSSLGVLTISQALRSHAMYIHGLSICVEQEPSSNQFMPTSWQLRVIQYARTISHDSPAPQSYHPAMGRRQRRQPINPPRCSRLHGAAYGVLDRGYIESFRKRKLSIGGYTASNFENERFPYAKPLLFA